LTDEDICRAFHMPRHKVQVGPDPATGNVEDLNLQYWTDCLQDHVEGLEQKLKYGIELDNVPGRTLDIWFDEMDLIRMNRQAQMTFATEGVRAAIFSPNRARAMFDEPPTAGGDSPMLQQQMFSLEALAERDENDPFAKPETPQSTAPPDATQAADTAEPKAMPAADLLRFRTKLLDELERAS
jgi:phage portal protein BeeE